MSIKDKLISNTTYLSLNWFFITLFSAVFWIIIAKTLPPESLAIVAISFQISTILSGISVLGLSSAINKLIPEMLERGNRDKIQGLILFSFKFTFITSLIIATTLVLLSGSLSTLLQIQKETLWAAAVLIIFMTPVTIFDYIYHGFQNMKKLFLTNFLGGLFKITLVWLLIFFGFGYFGAIFAILLSYAITFVSRLEKRILRISKTPVVDKDLILKFSMPALTVFIFSAMLNESQFVLLSMMGVSAYQTGLFAVGVKISNFIPIIPIILFSALVPIISGLSANKKSKTRQSYLVKLVFRYSLFFILPVSVFLIILSKYAILLFSTPEYLSATNLLAILITAFMFRGLASFLLSNLYSIGRPKKYRDIQIASSFAYLLLAVPFTYFFSATGLATSYLLSNIFLFVLSVVCLGKHLKFMPPRNDIFRVLFSVLISSALIVAMMQYVDNFWMAGVVAIIGGFSYLMILLKLDFYIEEDLTAVGALSNKIPLFKEKILMVRKYAEKFVKRSYREQ